MAINQTRSTTEGLFPSPLFSKTAQKRAKLHAEKKSREKSAVCVANCSFGNMLRLFVWRNSLPGPTLELAFMTTGDCRDCSPGVAAGT